MLKLIVRGIVANLGRLILTLIAVVLGVSAVSGSFILADSLRSVFNQISEDALAGIDAQVRPIPSDIASAFGGGGLPTFDESIVDELEALPEVDRAAGQVSAIERVYTVDAEGEIVRPAGPPVFANSWSGDSEVSAFTLVDGTPPSGQQIAIDQGQAQKGGFSIGEMVDVSLANGTIEQFELSGLIDFGEGGTGGAYFILMDLPTIQRATETTGLINSIDLAAAGDLSGDDLVDTVSPLLPDGLEAVPQDVLIEENQESFGQVIDIFGNILLGFAFVILFVSIFIIYNTFAILVGQRTRQLGLLRSIGASANQIRFMVLIEAVLIGLLASLIGLLGGIGVASLLKWVFSQGGNQFPEGPLEIQPRTIAVVFAVGLFVTVASALIPAFRAAKVAPLEAVRDGGRKERSASFRVVTGSIVLVPGLILFGLALAGSFESTRNTFVGLGVGGALIFIGVSMLSALFAGVVASGLGLPVQSIKGITGRLARDNASRNPQRTSATATALMIGLALITGVAILTASVIRNFDEILEDAIGSDLVLYQPPQGQPFSPALIEPLKALDEVETVSGYAAFRGAIDDDVFDLRAWDSDTGASVINMGLTDGTLESLGTDGIAVFDETATERGLSLGDSVTFEFEDGAFEDFEIRALYDNSQVVDGVSWLFDRAVASEHVATDTVLWIGVSLVGGDDPESAAFADAQAKVEAIVKDQPQIEVQNNSEFRQAQIDQLNQIQILIIGLLAMCIVVAFFGIVNTMVLSILERTREIGLLRAVGTTRSQLRTAIRWEAVIVSLFGSLLGVIMGIGLGWATVTAIPDSFLSFVAIPWGQIAIYLVIGALIGVVAALFPGARAARLNVLDAIAHE